MKEKTAAPASKLPPSQPATAISAANRNDPQSSPPTSATRKEILFRLVATCARSVLLAADFTGWNQAPIRMAKAVGGVWNVKVPLPPGKYRYRFLIDPDKPTRLEAGRTFPLPFGTLSGIVEVRD